MTRKERFLTAVGGGQPDSVPLYDFLFQQPMYRELTGVFPITYNSRNAIRLALALDHDAVAVSFGAPDGYVPDIIEKDVYRDEWGTTFKKNEASWPGDAPVAHPIARREDLRGYEPPDPTLPGRTRDIEAAHATDRDDIALIGSVTGPFTQVWMMMGYENLSYALYDDPGLIGEISAMSVEYSRVAAKRSVEAGCDAVWICDDFGSSTGGFVRPGHFREHILPHFAALAEFIHSLGVPVLLHSCGRITDYLDDLVRTPISALHPLQRTAGMDLREVKETYGERLCIIGNIDSSRTLPYGSPEDVRREVREAIDIAAPGGGYVLASDHSLHDGIPVENITAMFEEGRRYGRMVYGP